MGRKALPLYFWVFTKQAQRAAKHSRLYGINALMQRIYADPARPAQWAAERMNDEIDLADPE